MVNMDEKTIKRFWGNVNKQDGCWTWKKSVQSAGYGNACVGGGKTKLAHRVSWYLVNGEIPDGLFLCHKCDNPRCVNPNHLFLGTQTDNMRDCANKGRNPYTNRGKTYAEIYGEEEAEKQRLIRSNALKGRPVSEEMRKRISTTMKGVPKNRKTREEGVTFK